MDYTNKCDFFEGHMWVNIINLMLVYYEWELILGGAYEISAMMKL